MEFFFTSEIIKILTTDFELPELYCGAYSGIEELHIKGCLILFLARSNFKGNALWRFASREDFTLEWPRLVSLSGAQRARDKTVQSIIRARIIARAPERARASEQGLSYTKPPEACPADERISHCTYLPRERHSPSPRSIKRTSDGELPLVLLR